MIAIYRLKKKRNVLISHFKEYGLRQTIHKLDGIINCLNVVKKKRSEIKGHFILTSDMLISVNKHSLRSENFD